MKCLGISLLAVAVCLVGCAKKPLETEFRPLQIRWTVASGEDESSMIHKDDCVILLTSRLMAEKLVLGSTAGELSYEVIIKKNLKDAEALDFTGVCSDAALQDLPECGWNATCDAGLKTVVKFHNGD